MSRMIKPTQSKTVVKALIHWCNSTNVGSSLVACGEEHPGSFDGDARRVTCAKCLKVAEKPAAK